MDETEIAVKPDVQAMIVQAQRRPMGDSWTYATSQQMAEALVRSVVVQCADYVFHSEEVTVGQGYMLRKKIKQHFGVEE
jgi:hypothetical protein